MFSGIAKGGLGPINHHPDPTVLPPKWYICSHKPAFVHEECFQRMCVLSCYQAIFIQVLIKSATIEYFPPL